MQPNAPRIPGIEQFRKMNPKTFSGNEGPLEAIEWLRSVEAIATAIRIPQLGWTEAVVFCLSHQAYIWWAAEQTHLTLPITWVEFKERFEAKFLSGNVKDDLRKEFEELKQGGRSLEAYDAEFHRLSQFAPELIQLPSTKARHFQNGLNAEIQRAMAAQVLPTYEAVLAAAQSVRNTERNLGKAPATVTERRHTLPQKHNF